MDFLGRIRKLDSSLQRGLDNSFARVFGGKVVPNELEECLKQEIEDFLMQDADGRFLAPNDFRIGVSPKDFENLSAGGSDLPSELADRMARYCRNNGWSLSGTVSVRVQLVDSLHTGQLKTASQFTEGYRDQSGFFGADGEEVAGGSGSLGDGSGPGARSSSPASAGGAGDGAGSATGSFGASGDPDAAGTSAAPGLGYPSADSRATGAGAAGAAAAGAGAAGSAAATGAAAAGAAAAGGAPVVGGAGASQSNREPEPAAERPTPRPESAYPPSAPSRPIQVPPGPSSPEERAITVTLHLQDGSNRTFEVRPGSNIIGRGTISDFRLPDTGVSRQHAEITWDGRDAVLVDLHSTNGTMVNDSPIDNWLLADGDVISMGHSVMEVRIR